MSSSLLAVSYSSPSLSSAYNAAKVSLHPANLSGIGSNVSKMAVGSRRRRKAAARRSFVCFAAASASPKFGQQLLVYVPPHPLVKHWVAVLRNAITPSPMFRSALAELGRLLTYEAVRDFLPAMNGQIDTPCGVADVEFVDPSKPTVIIPILRAGLVLAEQTATVVPHARTYHLGAVRDEETLQPSFYLNKLPASFPEGTKVLLMDPMLATGGTMVAAVEEVVKRGVQTQDIRIISAIAAPPALEKLNKGFPGLRVYTGIIDPGLNDKGFIVPGLGDAGDRSFATE